MTTSSAFCICKAILYCHQIFFGTVLPTVSPLGSLRDHDQVLFTSCHLPFSLYRHPQTVGDLLPFLTARRAFLFRVLRDPAKSPKKHSQRSPEATRIPGEIPGRISGSIVRFFERAAVCSSRSPEYVFSILPCTACSGFPRMLSELFQPGKMWAICIGPAIVESLHVIGKGRNMSFVFCFLLFLVICLYILSSLSSFFLVCVFCFNNIFLTASHFGKLKWSFQAHSHCAKKRPYPRCHPFILFPNCSLYMQPKSENGRKIQVIFHKT